MLRHVSENPNTLRPESSLWVSSSGKHSNVLFDVLALIARPHDFFLVFVV
ncbi:hypothetical protein Acr_13g0017360 [Actinidia rufa]|uniref:Uncharacterized protein n=1 Tax=Actinidia rufa TaxID=165716 RepID=A0A7J0FPK5_9ERIC|nr:hypothetical protein Acr_13g0017360 [Actinidia rufa]